MSEYLLLFFSAIVSRAVNLLGLFRRPRSLRILVVKIDHLGDVVLAQPAIRALYESHPEVPMDVLISPGTIVALQGNPCVARMIAYDSPRFRRSRAVAPNGRSPLQTIRDVARSRYSTIVELRGDWWTLLLPFLTGATNRVDRGSVRLESWIARRFSKQVRSKPPQHEVSTNLEIVRPLLVGPLPERPALELYPTQPARGSMIAKLETLGVDFTAPICCLHPGAAWRPRAWRAERFAAVADWLDEHYHAQVAIVGSPEERDIEAAVRSKVKGRRIFWLAGALTLPELAALLERTRLYIGNDSGPAHLAAACGISSVALFGPQEPARFRPWSERTIVLHHRVHCCPCLQVVCVHPENPCVNLIEVEEVKSHVRQILGPPESFR